MNTSAASKPAETSTSSGANSCATGSSTCEKAARYSTDISADISTDGQQHLREGGEVLGVGGARRAPRHVDGVANAGTAPHRLLPRRRAHPQFRNKNRRDTGTSRSKWAAQTMEVAPGSSPPRRSCPPGRSRRRHGGAPRSTAPWGRPRTCAACRCRGARPSPR
eukprot:COSAG01_NODE_1422_length_10360_cov_36.853815_5_plen_164_part_00